MGFATAAKNGDYMMETNTAQFIPLYYPLKYLACALIAAWAGCTLSACGVSYGDFAMGSTSYLAERNAGLAAQPEHTDAERKQLTAIINGARYGND